MIALDDMRRIVQLERELHEAREREARKDAHIAALLADIKLLMLVLELAQMQLDRLARR